MAELQFATSYTLEHCVRISLGVAGYGVCKLRFNLMEETGE